MSAAAGRLGHLLVCRPPMPVVVLVWLGASTAVDATGIRAASAVFVAAATGYLLLAIRQRRRLCLGCAAAVPLDPGGEAARRLRWLRLAHWQTASSWLPIAVLAVPVLALAAVALTVDLPAFGLAVAAAVMPAAVGIHAMALHERLRPWCPWCRGGGGGEPDDPEPDPDPAVGRRPAQVG